MKSFRILLLLVFSFLNTKSQILQSGFDIEEYKELLKVTARQVDTPWTEENVPVPYPNNYHFVYRSDIVGLDNLWDLWLHRDKKVAILSIRGTTANSVSWLENFYAAMVSANGQLTLANGKAFDYNLSNNPNAAVHAGWLLGMAHLSGNMLDKVDSLYQSGYKDFIILGHSQGGAISFLFRSHVYYLQQNNKLPKDITFKTYSSAAPKPGNLYYAYDYEHINFGGWAFTVVNAADWVPETPLSLQTLQDFNKVNPFKNAASMLSNQPFPQNIVLKLVYNSLKKPGDKLLNRYQKYLGSEAFKMVNKNIPSYQEPSFYNSNNYMRAGTPIILMPDEEYKKQFPDNDSTIFIHHFPEPYLFLADKL